MKKNIAIALRGHIRDSLDDKYLYDFLNKITSIYNVDIYIYTFNIKSSGKIYTKENKEIDNKNINEGDILNYMKDLSQNINKLVIDPQNSAPNMNDRLIGNISRNKYQHMWKSIFNVINLVKESNIKYDFVVNMRIDYFQLINKFNFLNKVSPMQKLFKINILDFMQKINQEENICFPNIIDCTQIKQDTQNEILKNIKEKKLSKLFKNILYDENDILYGIDNLFAGKIDYLHKLSYIFYNQTDAIFDFLESIIEDLKLYSKLNGGSGGPHEVVLPLFIKNKLNNH
jgi:hypothetical protein